jgi:hypothetical protein
MVVINCTSLLEKYSSSIFLRTNHIKPVIPGIDEVIEFIYDELYKKYAVQLIGPTLVPLKLYQRIKHIDRKKYMLNVNNYSKIDEEMHTINFFFEFISTSTWICITIYKNIEDDYHADILKKTSINNKYTKIGHVDNYILNKYDILKIIKHNIQ